MECSKPNAPAPAPATTTYVLTQSLTRLLGVFSGFAWMRLEGEQRKQALELFRAAQRELVMLQLTDVHARALVRELRDLANGGSVALLELLIGRHLAHLENGIAGAGVTSPAIPNPRVHEHTRAAGGERGIRTPDTLAGTPDFESARPLSQRKISLGALEHELFDAPAAVQR